MADGIKTSKQIKIMNSFKIIKKLLTIENVPNDNTQIPVSQSGMLKTIYLSMLYTHVSMIDGLYTENASATIEKWIDEEDKNYFAFDSVEGFQFNFNEIIGIELPHILPSFKSELVELTTRITGLPVSNSSAITEYILKILNLSINIYNTVKSRNEQKKEIDL